MSYCPIRFDSFIAPSSFAKHFVSYPKWKFNLNNTKICLDSGHKLNEVAIIEHHRQEYSRKALTINNKTIEPIK